MRQNPVIIWGIDCIAQSILEQFEASNRLSTFDRGTIKIFKPNIDFAQGLGEMVVGISELPKSTEKDGIADIAVIFSSFIPDAGINLKKLRDVSIVLKKTATGFQNITVIILVPPLIASETEKIYTYEFFLEMEQLIGNIPYITIVFVNEISIKLYKILNINKSVEAILVNGDNSKAQMQAIIKQDFFKNKDAFIEINELLYQELIGGALEDPIRGIGYGTMAAIRTINGRKGCYSTIGSIKIIYHRLQTKQYLRAKFQCDLYFLGLNNNSILSDKEISIIKKHVDKFIDD